MEVIRYDMKGSSLLLPLREVESVQEAVRLLKAAAKQNPTLRTAVNETSTRCMTRVQIVSRWVPGYPSPFSFASDDLRQLQRSSRTRAHHRYMEGHKSMSSVSVVTLSAIVAPNGSGSCLTADIPGKEMARERDSDWIIKKCALVTHEFSTSH